MKKVILIIAITQLFFAISVAQNNFNCLSHEVHLEQLKNDPQYKINQELLERETEQFIKNQAANKTTSATYIIPIVFHVIHTGGAGNISAAQIIDQVAILNKEFKRQQADTSLTPAAFKPLAAAIDVEFRLATKDPNGNCTNGIDRIYNSLATCSYVWDEVKALSYWPSTNYLNIWVVESMHYPGNNACVGGGYSAFPGGPANKDGVVMRGDLIGSIGTAATNSSWGNFKGRYLVHELGHWFNLIHIWGNTNCGNDLVNDTPPAVLDNSGCPIFPRRPNNSCGSDANGEMFTNYMDYTNGNCLNMFTIGQVMRMTAAINSSSTGKSNLWKPANLTLTGTNDPYIYPAACGAKADILPYGTLVVCQGDSVKFTDYSYGGQSTSRLWDFSGQPATSLTDSIVKVKYNTPGTYSMALTKNYLSTSNTATYLDKVQVMSKAINSNYVIPFVDSLESNVKFDNEWTVVNRSNDARTWRQVNTTSFSGTGCAGIMNFGGSAPSVDELISPPYDLSSVVSATLNYKLHATSTNTANTDRLMIHMSSDCGSQWFFIAQKVGSGLRTVTALQNTSHIPPAGSNEWRSESVELPNNFLNGPVRIRFSYTSGGGNNVFIDDINIIGDQALGITTQLQTKGIVLYPNPAKDQLTIAYSLTNKSSVELEIFDVLGRMCFNKNEDQVKEGKNTSAIDVTNFTNGIYTISLKQNNRVIYTSKFLKQKAD